MRTATATSLLAIAAGVPLLLLLTSPAAETAPKQPVRKATGIEKRVPWTTSKVKGSPEPPDPYRVEVAFPKLKFFEPLDMASAAGTDRLFVATRPGKIYSFVNDPKTEKAELLLDIKKTL